MFGLPKGYLAGNGHHLDWEKKKDENKGKGKKKTNNKAKATGKGGAKGPARPRGKNQKEEIKPDWFDLTPFKQSLERFSKANAEKRSELRTALITFDKQLKSCFKDSHGENSFKKCVDMDDLKLRFTENNIVMNPEILDDVSSLL